MKRKRERNIVEKKVQKSALIFFSIKRSKKKINPKNYSKIFFLFQFKFN